MQPIQEVFPLLSEPKKIFITTHHKPDGDAIGSMLGLAHYLSAKGHDVTAASPGDLPEFLMWMPGVGRLLNYEFDSQPVVAAINRADLIFCVDFNHFGRTKHLEELLTNAKATQGSYRSSSRTC